MIGDRAGGRGVTVRRNGYARQTAARRGTSSREEVVVGTGAPEADATPPRHRIEPLALGRDDDAVGYRAQGELDSAALLELRNLLRGPLTDGRAVVLDLSGVTFMNSAVLATLLSGRRLATAFGTSLRLRSPSAACRRVLDIAGLADRFDIETGDSSAGRRA
jgi:anti-anti-sigma factor